jgi:hypothetical protein
MTRSKDGRTAFRRYSVDLSIIANRNKRVKLGTLIIVMITGITANSNLKNSGNLGSQV